MKKLCLRSGVLAAVAGRRAPNVDFGDSVSCVGGSSLIANLAAIGVLLAIHARGRVSRYSRRR